MHSSGQQIMLAAERTSISPVSGFSDTIEDAPIEERYPAMAVKTTASTGKTSGANSTSFIREAVQG